MNGMLIDTNVLIYLSKRELELETFITNQSHLYISVITYMEALGFQFRSKQEEQSVRAICDQSNETNIMRFQYAQASKPITDNR